MRACLHECAREIVKKIGQRRENLRLEKTIFDENLNFFEKKFEKFLEKKFFSKHKNIFFQPKKKNFSVLKSSKSIQK